MSKRLSSDILIDEHQIQRRVAAMAAAISADSPEGGSLSVLALMDGAFMFCTDLVRLLPMPVRVAFVPMPSVGRGGDPSKAVFPPDFPIRGADVLVVEDVLDTGQTLQTLNETLLALEPSRLRLAVLLDKPSQRISQVKPDYVGFTIENHWVVGYGLDSDGLYRNLPYISCVEDS